MDIAQYKPYQECLLNEIADELEHSQKTMVYNKAAKFVSEKILDKKERILQDDNYGLALLMQLPLWIENSGIDWLNTKNWGNIIRNHKATYDDILEEYLPENVIDDLTEMFE